MSNFDSTIPQVGEGAIIPADGSRGDISVRRDRETGEWAIEQRAGHGEGGRLRLTRAQHFALRTLLSQDTWA